MTFLILYYFGLDLPSELTLLEYSPPRTTQIITRDGELMEEYATEHRVIVKFDEIPAIIKGAFIMAEDREFYQHSGISANSLMRAIIDNTARKAWNKHPAGGSTITQQIAKNLLVGNARTVTRKIREAIMAFRIETTIPKDKILEIYLNHLYLGKGCYGIVEACNYYFGKSLKEIEPHEAAFLASIPNAPTLYINDKTSRKLLRKRNSVLLQMYDAGYINKSQLRKYFNKPLKINHKKQKLYAPYFADEIFRLVTKHVSRNDFFRNGYVIRATLDKLMQYHAQQALENGIIEYTKRTRYHGVLGNIHQGLKIDLRQLDSHQLFTTLNAVQTGIVEKVATKYLICKAAGGEYIKVEINGPGYTSATFKKGDIVLCRKLGKNSSELYQEPKVTGGIVVMDACTGEVLALVGGYSPYLSIFNCMTQARRQPGSTIKPFVYATALENGKDEYDLIEDKPVKIVLPSGEKYMPKNYDGKAHGKTYLRDGLIYSRNLSTVNLALDIGLDKIGNTLKALGLAKNKVPISAVLGAIEVCPLKLMEAFSVFFNDGIPVFPKFIIGDTFATNETAAKRIFATRTVETMKDILHDAVVKGTNSEVEKLEKKYNVKIYGKTGTTNDYKDTWFLGAVQDQARTLLVCTFVGYSKPQTLGDHMTGAKVAFPIFMNFVKSYFESKNN